jgi:hypothetical protein
MRHSGHKLDSGLESHTTVTCWHFAMEEAPAWKVITRDDALGTDVVHLNVTGKQISVLRSTLLCLEGSALARLAQDKGGVVFIDQPAELFMAMIDFLQCRRNAAPATSPFPTVDDFGGNRNQFLRFADMVSYYGMTPIVLPTAIKIFDFFRSSANVRISDLYVEAWEKAAFKLYSQSPRRIRSFEVTIVKIDNLQIGWSDHSVESGGEEIGLAPLSIGFDVFGSSVARWGFFRRKITPLAVRLGDLTVIRCERKDSDLVWTVGGESYVECGKGGKFDSYDPSFSGKGTWRISKVEF